MVFRKYGVCTLIIMLSILSSSYIFAATDKKKSVTPVNELSCSKQARRIAKITDQTKRRAYIKECREKREAAEKLAQEKKKKEGK